MIEKYSFDGQNNGHKILLTGRVHGNEPCGEIALRRVIDNLNNGALVLNKGSVTIMPCCNPKASQANKRFIDINLNRIMADDLVDKNIEAYEATLAPQIMREMDDHDVFVDLHSFTENMPPLVICIDHFNETSKALAQACRIQRIECDSPMITKAGAQMTTHYARHQNIPAVLVECGSHNDPQSIEVAYQSILNILIHLNMIDGELPAPMSHEFMVVKSAIYNSEDHGLIFPLMEKDEIHKGDDLFKTPHGDIIHATESGKLFMRNPNTPIGEEYAYICDIYDDWP